ncbi:MAG: diguanylate cyclase [Chloroflexi bacterium]|nr:diguanylate cyclase [Chloroflexota bacterium]
MRRNSDHGDDMAARLPWQAYFRDILDSFADRVVAIDRDCRIAFANRAFLRQEQLVSHVRVRHHCCDVLEISSGNCPPPTDDCPVRAVLATGRPLCTQISRHDSRLAKTAHLEISASPLFNPQGDVDQVVLMLREIAYSGEVEDLVSRLRAAERRKSTQAVALARVAKTIGATLDSDKVLRVVAEEAVALLQTDRCLLLLLNDAGHSLSPASFAASNPNLLPERSDFYISVDDAVWRFVLTQREVLAIDALASQGLATQRAFEGDEARSVLVAPLVAEDTALGILYVDHVRSIHHWTDEEKALAATLADQAAIAIRNAQLHQEVKDLANTDGLTSLYNYRYFYQRLTEEFARSRRSGHHLSLVFVDVDNLKGINDSFGHLAGDAVLRDLSRLIKDTVRASDVVARYGGDEFALILPDTDVDQAVTLARRLERKVAAKLLSKDEVPLLSVSVGIASLSPDTFDEAHLVSDADRALYQAKTLGKGRICVFRNQEPCPT